jgi:hypothetical protein
MLDAILGPLWGYIIAAAGVAFAAIMTIAFGRGKKTEGAAQERAKHVEQTQAKVDAGRKAVAANRGKSPADRLRANNDKWK